MYAIIVSANFINLEQPYRVINQIFAGDESDRTKLPYILLEDDFSESQTAEIAAQGGQVFADADAYHVWRDSVENGA